MTEFKELEHTKNIYNWMEKMKVLSDEFMEKMNAENIIQTITLFDNRYKNHAFELSLKIRKKNSDD